MSVGTSYCVVASNTESNSSETGISIGGPYDLPNQINIITGNSVSGSGLDDLLDDNEASEWSADVNVWSAKTVGT
ncbi:hypothetical protein BTJ40_13155 [Microbulbifer sp. A4B17]|uniref:hypothetical protein n=1 Tax=Microbulbifer sp. A4B17 TaxID=359370 RepID=UPI000D52E62C|nr:hypothetical protein [Microbulbifer sp. A4B17]AWF81698.1 hypothetical protein BTJ40_13155 [Microbulbifer sp. A4B17]